MNIEKHRGYITTHRVDDSYTALYKPMENTFISIGKGEGNGNLKETIYKMDTTEKNLLRNFLEVRNNGLNNRSLKTQFIAPKLNYYSVA